MLQVWSFCKPQTNEGRARFWPADKLQTRKQICWWVVECSSSSSVSCQVPTKNCRYLAKRCILVLPEWWGVCFQDDQWYLILIFRSFQQVRSDRLPWKCSLQSQLLDISKQLQVTPKWLKLISWGIKELTSHQASPSGNNIPTSKDQRFRRGTQMNTRSKDHPLRNVIQSNQTKEEIDIQSVVTPSM